MHSYIYAMRITSHASQIRSRSRRCAAGGIGPLTNWVRVFSLSLGTFQSRILFGSLVLIGKNSALDAVDRQFEPYPDRRMRLDTGGALVV